jgi:hypothetical protein
MSEKSSEMSFMQDLEKKDIFYPFNEYFRR